MLTQIMQIDEQLCVLFSEEADPEPEDIHTLLSARQQMLEKILPDLSEDNKKQLHILTEKMLISAQKTRARYALTLFQHKRSQRGVKAYQTVSLQ
ncbi:MAG: hypothetical protein ACRCZT_02035 [Plesiomonas sp.]